MKQLIRIVCVLVPIACTTLIDPPRVEWGCELSNERVKQGIYAASIERGWSIIQDDSKGNIVAKIVVRGKHTLVVSITFDSKSYDVTYKSSKNLRYIDTGNGTASVHGKVNQWIHNIHQDISKKLSALCLLE